MPKTIATTDSRREQELAVGEVSMLNIERRSSRAVNEKNRLKIENVVKRHRAAEVVRAVVVSAPGDTPSVPSRHHQAGDRDPASGGAGEDRLVRVRGLRSIRPSADLP